jgi:hypothetical protein
MAKMQILWENIIFIARCPSRHYAVQEITRNDRTGLVGDGTTMLECAICNPRWTANEESESVPEYSSSRNPQEQVVIPVPLSDEEEEQVYDSAWLRRRVFVLAGARPLLVRLLTVS